VEDLYKFAQALSESGFLSVAARSLMWTALDLPWMNDRGPYGYGWWVFQKSDVAARPVVKGTGGMEGFLSALLYFPKDHTTIIVLQNSVGAELSIQVQIERQAFEAWEAQ
jgi:CubicO group peptidase (beta-lactamase class C family)